LAIATDHAIFLIQAGAILLGLLRRVPEVELSRQYRDRMWRALKRRRDPILLRIYALKCAVHYHMHVMIRERGDNPYWGGTPFTAAFDIRVADRVDERAA